VYAVEFDEFGVFAETVETANQDMYQAGQSVQAASFEQVEADEAEQGAEQQFGRGCCMSYCSAEMAL